MLHTWEPPGTLGGSAGSAGAKGIAHTQLHLFTCPDISRMVAVNNTSCLPLQSGRAEPQAVHLEKDRQL